MCSSTARAHGREECQQDEARRKAQLTARAMMLFRYASSAARASTRASLHAASAARSRLRLRAL